MKHEQVKAILEQIKALFPEIDPDQGSIAFVVRGYTKPEVSSHGFKTYEAGTEFMRACGCGVRDKDVYPEGRCVLRGVNEGVEYIAFVSDIPPTCRLEKVKVKVPKKDTIDTGEFIEMESTKVVCGSETHVEA